MATETKQTNRMRAVERMRKNNPERNYEDEEELFGQMNDDYDNYDKQLTEANSTRDKLNEMLDTDPRSAAFLTAWHDGQNPVMAFIEEYGEDIVSDITNPDNKAKIEESSKKYLEKLAKSKELDAQYEKNIAESQSVYNDMVDSGEYSEEQINGALDMLEKICGDFIVGKVSKESIVACIKAGGYDNDVAAAKTEGEIAGRNQTIQKNRKVAAKGDGMPNTAGGGAKNVQTPVIDEARYGALGRTKTSIWDK